MNADPYLLIAVNWLDRNVHTQFCANEVAAIRERQRLQCHWERVIILSSSDEVGTQAESEESEKSEKK